jgi:hypothetical protein
MVARGLVCVALAGCGSRAPEARPASPEAVWSLPVLSESRDHLVVRLADRSPWGPDALLSCAQQWTAALKTKVVLEGSIAGATRHVVVVDASGRERRAAVEGGRFRIVAGGESASEVAIVELAPIESRAETVKLLWLHAAAINARVTGLVMSPREGTWFVRSLQKGSPAAAAGLELGDVITAINGQPLARAGPAALEEIFARSAIDQRIEYRRCDIAGQVTLARVPRGLLWTSEADCPCVSGSCSPIPGERPRSVSAPRACP